MSSTTPRRPSPLHGAIATAALPVITLAGMTATAGASQAAQPAAGKAPTARNIMDSRAQVHALVSAKRSASKTVTVKKGDSVWKLAHRHHVPVQKVLDLNHLKGDDFIFPGQKIKISGSASHPKAKQSSPSRGSGHAASGSSSAGAKKHTVKAGDTLSGIAHRHGMSLSELLKLNSLKTSSVIYPGQHLKLAGSAKAASAPKAKSSSHGAVPKKFLHYTYSDATNQSANANHAALRKAPVPSRAAMRQIVAKEAARYGVNQRLALAHAEVESGFDQRSVSPANAVGVMQVLPSTAEWLSASAGRKLNVLDPYDNATAGVLYIRYLQRNAKDRDHGIAGYYAGLKGAEKRGIKKDVKDYVDKVKSHL